MKAPGVYEEIIDESTPVSTAIVGLVAFFGVTEFGDHTRPVVIGSLEDYEDNFGGLIAESNFPLYCRRALQGGAKLLIGRAVHYTNPADHTTVAGTKATMSKVVASPVAAVRATATITITNAGATGNIMNIIVLAANGQPILLGTATVAGSETPTTFAAKVAAAVTALTGSHGYTATSAVAVATITAPVGSGTSANGYVFSNAATGTVAYSQTAFTGGVNAQAVINTVLTASTVGTWGNNVYSYALPAASGLANSFDLYVGLTGNDRIINVITDIPVSPTQPQIDSYNALLTWAQITSMATMAAFTSTMFTTGAEDKTLISTMDYVGSQTEGTGIYVFDSTSDATKIACPDIVDPLVDQALANYVDMRKDMNALVRTPVGLTPQGAVDYRNGTGAYSHAKINSWRTFMFYGGLKVTHPTTGKIINIGELGDIAYVATKKDNNSFPWMSLAGPTRGLLTNVKDVVYNVGTTARNAQFELLTNAGVNAVINDDTYGVALWDNVTLGPATLLKHANISELLVYLHRTITPLAKSKLFEPNDTVTWKQIWRLVDRAAKYVKDNRGIYDYKYVGDQFAETVEQATLNTSVTRDQGIYIFKLYIKPAPAMREVEVKVIVSNSDVDFSIVG